MKSLILALAASAAIVGGAHAQQGAATATDQQTESTTTPADQAAPVTGTDAENAEFSPESGDHNTASAPPSLMRSPSVNSSACAPHGRI